jgi:GNAT superfamily N-acetyltransferase
MDITQVTSLPTLEAFHRVEVAEHEHDFIALPADPLEELLPLLEGKEKAGEISYLYLATDGSDPVGTITLRLPTLDNLTTVNLALSVHPRRRRQGVATALLAFALEEVQRLGRRRVFMEVPSSVDGGDPQAAALLRMVGAKPVNEDHRRLLDLSLQPPGAALPAPEGYRVVQWVDQCPDELVDGVAYLSGRMSIDAPMGEMDYEPEVWNAARYREKEATAISRGRKRMATAVVHAMSGSVAGVTDIGVNLSRPEYAYQWDTIVEPTHRGQRLGMVLKTWNHRHLVTEVTDAHYLSTWNAASNTFMIAVNDALGFRPIERWTEYQLDL